MASCRTFLAAVETQAEFSNGNRPCLNRGKSSGSLQGHSETRGSDLQDLFLQGKCRKGDMSFNLKTLSLFSVLGRRMVTGKWFVTISLSILFFVVGSVTSTTRSLTVLKTSLNKITKDSVCGGALFFLQDIFQESLALSPWV